MSDSKGRKTKRITFNLHERGRQFLGKDRSNVDMNEMIKQINSPQIQEMAKTGTLYGYNGHEIRKRYGMNPPDSVIVDGKVVYLERAFRTLEVYADKEGNVSHVTEFLDNPSGEYARKQYQARVGGFSSAQNYKRAGLGLIPVEQDGLVACFDSATDLTQLSASEAMIAHLLEQQIVRDYDNIHTQTELLNMHGQALDQIDVLSNQVARKERREALQAQRQHDLYSGMVGEVRSFDSVCEEADALLSESDLARMRINGETPKDKKPKPRIFKSMFGF